MSIFHRYTLLVGTVFQVYSLASLPPLSLLLRRQGAGAQREFKLSFRCRYRQEEKRSTKTRSKRTSESGQQPLGRLGRSSEGRALGRNCWASRCRLVSMPIQRGRQGGGALGFLFPKSCLVSREQLVWEFPPSLSPVRPPVYPR